MSDGAAVMVLSSSRTAQLKNLIPLAKIISWAQIGIDPLVMVVDLFLTSRKHSLCCSGFSTHQKYSRSFT